MYEHTSAKRVGAQYLSVDKQADRLWEQPQNIDNRLITMTMSEMKAAINDAVVSAITTTKGQVTKSNVCSVLGLGCNVATSAFANSLTDCSDYNQRPEEEVADAKDDNLVGIRGSIDDRSATFKEGMRCNNEVHKYKLADGGESSHDNECRWWQYFQQQ